MKDNGKPFKYYNGTLIVLSVAAACMTALIANAEKADASEKQNWTPTTTKVSAVDDNVTEEENSLDAVSEEASSEEYTETISAEIEEIAGMPAEVEEVYVEIDEGLYEEGKPSSNYLTIDDIWGSEEYWGITNDELWSAEQEYCSVFPENVPVWDYGCIPEKKTYMYYTSVTDTASRQWALLHSRDAYTDMTTGIRMVGDRYCIAVGSYYSTTVGEKIDVVLENGHIIKCIVGDCKADIHTNETNQYGAGTGDVVEFIVDSGVFDYLKDSSGTVNWVWGFDGKVTKIVPINYTLHE